MTALRATFQLLSNPNKVPSTLRPLPSVGSCYCNFNDASDNRNHPIICATLSKALIVPLALCDQSNVLAIIRQQ